MLPSAAGPTIRPANPTLFFGWRVVAAAFTVLFVAYGIQFSFGVQVDHRRHGLDQAHRCERMPCTGPVLGIAGGLPATDRFGPPGRGGRA
jgi:hypothetical protein